MAVSEITREKLRQAKLNNPVRYWLGKKRPTGEKSAHWKGGKPNCIFCGKKLTNKDAKTCWKHMGLLKMGENHPLWIQDRTILKDDHQDRGGQLHRDWSKGVKKRDGYKCRIGNKDCNGQLEAHHILGWTSHPELRYQINNGITLCHAHHPRKREEEAKLSPYFQSLVAEMK